MDDRERCLASGMDGYITKPIHKFELLQAIAGQCCRRSPASASAMEVTVNGQEVLAKCGNDTKLLGELCKLFVEESSRLIKTLGDAVANRDADAIQRTAHTLRGSTQFFSTGAAVESLKELEAIARRGALGEADKVFARLVQEMNGVREATARLPAEVGPAEDAVGVS